MDIKLRNVKDGTLLKWLKTFSSTNTQSSYRNGLRKFKKNLEIADLGEYLQSNPDTTNDMRKFLASLKDRPSKTVSAYTAAVKMFMQDHKIPVDPDAWRIMKRRGFRPKRIRAVTRDKIPSKTQLKQILDHADIKCRSLVLFLLSSGARIGETLQLKIEDFELDLDPPRVNIRDEYTKGKMCGRTAYFSYEARNKIKEWLKVKDNLHRRGTGKSYESKRMFPFSESTAMWMFNTACDKAGLGKRDNGTNRRLLHFHSLRKFFRTKIGLDLDITNALLGHTEYLDRSYLRLEEAEEIAAKYKEAMHNVSVYAVEDPELKKRMNGLATENLELKERISDLEKQVKIIPDIGLKLIGYRYVLSALVATFQDLVPLKKQKEFVKRWNELERKAKLEEKKAMLAQKKQHD